MGDWVFVCATSQLLPGESTVAWDGDTPILVFNYDGDFYALEDQCSHEDFELSAGQFDARGSHDRMRAARREVRRARRPRRCARRPTSRWQSFPVKVEDVGGLDPRRPRVVGKRESFASAKHSH